MIRSVLIAVALCLSVLFLPLWGTVLLFFIALFTAPHRLVLLFPAVLFDVLYAPQATLVPWNMVGTLSVLGVLALYWALRTHTRLSHFFYDVETK